MNFRKKYYNFYSVLTNGETELEITSNKYDCFIDPGEHIYGEDGFGNSYIDGKLAHIELRDRCTENMAMAF